MKHIGIDLGHYSVKIFEVSASAKGLQLLNYNEHILNSDPVADNQLIILDILRGLTAVNDPAMTKYIVCVPQSRISTRYKFFPFRERSKVLKSIPFELEDDIPFAQDEAIFEAKFVRYRGNTSEVLASACPKAYVEEVLTFFNDAGIDPDIVSGEGLAFANLVEDFNAPPPQETLAKETDEDEESAAQPTEQGYLLLNVGHTKTLIAAFRGFNLVYVRSIEWGGREVARAIATKYDISYQEALREMESKSFVLTTPEGASRDQIAFSNIISGALNELIRELKLSIIDIKAEFHLNLTHMSMTGGASQIKNLGAFFTHSLELPTNSLDYLNRFSEVFVDRNPQLMAQAGTALSLAIEGVKRPINPPTDFRKDELGKQSQVFQLFWLRWGYTFKLALAAFAAFFIYAVIKDQLSSTLQEATHDALRKQARVVGVKGTSSRNVRQFIRQKQNDLKHRDLLVKLSKMNSALDVLNMISASAPKTDSFKMDVNQLSIDVDKVSLKGRVGKEADLNLLEKGLQALSANGKLKRLPAGRLAAGVPFNFEFSVDRKLPELRPKKKGAVDER